MGIEALGPVGGYPRGGNRSTGSHSKNWHLIPNKFAWKPFPWLPLTTLDTLLAEVAKAQPNLDYTGTFPSFNPPPSLATDAEMKTCP